MMPKSNSPAADDFFSTFDYTKPRKVMVRKRLEVDNDWLDEVSPKKPEEPKGRLVMTPEEWQKYCEDSPF